MGGSSNLNLPRLPPLTTLITLWSFVTGMPNIREDRGSRLFSSGGEGRAWISQMVASSSDGQLFLGVVLKEPQQPEGQKGASTHMMFSTDLGLTKMETGCS